MAPLPDRPNLTPFQVPGWAGAVVLQTRSGVFRPSALVAGQPTYYHWAVRNDGDVDTSRGYQLVLRANGTLLAEIQRPPLEAGEIDFEIDQLLRPSLLAGLDTSQPLILTMVVDPYDYIHEANEGDNTFQAEVALLPQESAAPIRTAYTEEELLEKLASLEGLMAITEDTITPSADRFLAEVLEVMDALYFRLYDIPLGDEPVSVDTLTDEEYADLSLVICHDQQVQVATECIQGLSPTDGFFWPWRDRKHIYMRGENAPARLLEIYAHELGHFRQGLLNPERLRENFRNLNTAALAEAQAYAHTMVMLREMEERLGRPLMLYPLIAGITTYVDARVETLVTRLTEDEHPRGKLFLWTALFADDHLADLGAELLREGRLSLGSSRLLYDYLVDIPWLQADFYVGTILSNLVQHLPTITAIAKARLVPGLSYVDEGSPYFIEEGLLLP